MKNKKIILLVSTLLATSLSLFSSATSADDFTAKQSKIVGGTKAAFGAWPSTVALLKVATIKKVESGNAHYSNGELIPTSHANYQAQFCGASLIDSKWVLTAAHCFVDKKTGAKSKAKDINVLVGATDLIKDGTRKSIKKILIHPDYNKKTGNNDIALLELETKTEVASIKIAEKDASVGTLATVVGWGALNKDITGFPSELYQVELPLVDHQVCESLYGKTEFTDNMICAGYQQGEKDSCQGDSGGPLMARVDGYYQQIGITSWGIGCAEPGLFGAYTRLSKFKNWIESTAKISLFLKTNKDDSGGGSLFFLLIPLFSLMVSTIIIRRKLIK